MLELAARTDDVVKQIPHFGLQKVLLESLAVRDLGLEDKFVVIVGELDGRRNTLAMPLEPHMPTDSKECLRGRRSTSLLSVSLIWFMAFSQSLYILSV